MPSLPIEINGMPARAQDLAFLAQVNYGHFTSMQVRERAARGFDLHLARLAGATQTLFGASLDVEQVREWCRRVLDDAPVSLRITVFSRALDRSRLERPVPVDVLVAVSPVRATEATALRLRSIVHERDLPSVKHVGTFGLFHHWREARMAGFDDVLFTTPAGSVSEGSIWNIGFWDGRSVVWPEAPMLDGITQQLLKLGLSARGIAQRSCDIRIAEIGALRSAFVMNSASVGRPIARIDATDFAVDSELSMLLDMGYQPQPWQRI